VLCYCSSSPVHIDIIDALDATNVFHPVPFRRVIKGPAQRKTKANNDRPSRPAPFPTSLTPAAPSKSSTPRHHRRPRRLRSPRPNKPLGTTRRHGSGESPRHLCTAPFCLDSFTTTAPWPPPPPPLGPPPPPRTLHPSPCHRTCTNISRHDAPLPRCAPAASSRISVASLRRKRKMRRRECGRQGVKWRRMDRE